MKSAIYPGSFDPITNGHLDVIERGAKIFDKIIVAVLINVEKKGLFDIKERVELIKKATQGIENVEVISFEGLLIDLLKQKETNIILKGLRTVMDFEYELQMALMNNKLDKEVETLFMATATETSFVSSSAVKQVAKFGGSIEGLVPSNIIDDIERKINRDDRGVVNGQTRN
ncbi:pantetheine-phosphate adenylyltransferase [Clostridium sardiniense]|uniref:pantetheine-phosphate adenylyltransferase n=1 Tax=Clostridium sardiniense TaxID=29369 RepID=UPI003D34BD1F